MTIAIILDVLVCAVALWGLISGLRHGFVWICFRKFRKITAAALSVFLAKPLGSLFTQWFLSDSLTKLIMSWANIQDTSATSPDEMIQQLPTVIRFIAEHFGLDVTALAQEAYASGEGMYYHFIRETSLPIARGIGVFLAWILVFLVSLILLRILLSIGTSITELPVVKQVNALLGGCVSLVFYAAILWISIKLIVWLSGLSAISSLSFMQDFSIEKTFVTKYIYAFQPLAFILSL